MYHICATQTPRVNAVGCVPRGTPLLIMTVFLGSRYEKRMMSRCLSASLRHSRVGH